LAELEFILKKVGERIAYYREKKGMNQSDLARAMDKDRQVVQKLETGKVNPTIKTLHEIASVLGIDITDLLN
jgi:putative transcriptional regulator